MKILIGYDGSECADAALDDLTHAGLPLDAEAQILSVGEVWQRVVRHPEKCVRKQRPGHSLS